MVNMDFTGKHHVLWNRERSPQPFYINNFIGSCSQGNLELEVHLGLVANIQIFKNTRKEPLRAQLNVSSTKTSRDHHMM